RGGSSTFGTSSASGSPVRGRWRKQMYLSKLVIDPAEPRANRTLSCVYLAHQAVMAGFDPGERHTSRVLFRLEPERDRGRAIILVQSEVPPNWERARHEFFGGRSLAQTKPFAVQLAKGQRL